MKNLIINQEEIEFDNTSKLGESNLINPFIQTELDIHRLFTTNSSMKPLIDIYGNFNKKQLRFIMYIILEVESDTINLNYNYLRSRFKVCSSTTIARDILSLETIGLIKKKSHGQYWINPFLFFKGDMKTYYKDTLKSIVLMNFPKLYLIHYNN
jgi:hypothetical protein